MLGLNVAWIILKMIILYALFSQFLHRSGEMENIEAKTIIIDAEIFDFIPIFLQNQKVFNYENILRFMKLWNITPRLSKYWDILC